MLFMAEKVKTHGESLCAKIGFGITSITGQVTIGMKKQWYSCVNEKDAIDFIEIAYNNGVRFFATDSINGIDNAESIFGRALARFRKNVVFCTKIGVKADGRSDFSIEYFQRRIEKSLNNFQTDYIDILHLNKIPVGKLKDSLLENIEKLKKEKTIRNFGISTIDANHAQEATALKICDSVQVMYNLANREIEEKNLHGKYIIVKSPLWTGMLTPNAMCSDNYPPNDLRATFLNPNELNKRRMMIREILNAIDWPVERLVELSIRYVFSNKYVGKVLFGFNRRQFQEVLELAEKGPLSNNELEKIRNFNK